MEENSSQPRLTLHYRGTLTKAGLIVTSVTSPVWGFWALYVAAGLGTAVIQGGLAAYWDLAALFCFYVALFLTGVFTIFVCLNNKLILTSEGIETPWLYALQMLFSRKRSWKELKQVRFVNECIKLKFKDIGGITLHQKGFNASELKDFYMAVLSNAPDAEFVFDDAAVKKGIAGLQTTRNDGSFTAIWEDELASRFGTTAYVPLETGATLQNGRLIVIGQVSFGGLSAVYLCRASDGATAILKEAVIPINSDKATREKALEMFEREANILKTLKHPDIARVIDHFIENQHNYLLLQHIEGIDLRQYVKENGPQSERVIIRWGLEIAKILSYLHGHSPPIIHRDLTPDNLVLDKMGNIKLIDFGAANELVGTATGTLVGKQSYISPEQFRGKAKTASDIYSLGCTLYYLATGNDPEALSQSSLEPALAEKMPTVDKLIQDCTALEIEDRTIEPQKMELLCREYLTATLMKAAKD